MERKKLIWKDLISDSQETFSLDMIEEFLNHKLDKNEFQKNYFSSKPKQITQAAINVSGRVFGNLKNVSIVTINNSDIAQAIFNNFKKKDKKIKSN